MKKIIFVISAIGATTIIIVFFIVFSFSQNPPTPKNPPLSLPTKIPGQLDTPTGKAISSIRYNIQKAEELVGAAQNRQNLSENGTTAKLKLIASLGGTSGRVYTTPTVSIEYIKSPDLFQGEINSSDIELAKQEAVNFMISQGFSNEDLCKLPFSFYLSPPARNSQEGSNSIFNPLPENC